MQVDVPTLDHPPPARQEPAGPEVLHYLGYDEDHGGIITVLRALAGTGRLRCVLGMNAGAGQRQTPALPMVGFPAVTAETIGPATVWRTLRVAWQARAWLRAARGRIFHGHSRAGLLVVLWLQVMGERRALASVHAYGNRKGFYRLAARLLGWRLFWLSPAMKQHYGLGSGTWEECLPDCIGPSPAPSVRAARDRGVVVFGAVGTLARCKRFDVLVEALVRLPLGIRRRVRLVHAGADGPNAGEDGCAAELRALAAHRGVADLIEWRGLVRPIDGFWPGIDCLVVPSPIEAFSVAALEALAAGVPVLASDQSGTRDLVEVCRGGWLFPGDSPEMLAAEMARLIESGDLARVRPTAAGLRPFRADEAVERYRVAYARLLGPDAK